VDLYVDVIVSETHTVSTFRAALKMEAVCSSETVISTYNPTRRSNPENQHRYDLRAACQFGDCVLVQAVTNHVLKSLVWLVISRRNSDGQRGTAGTLFWKPFHHFSISTYLF
jgi:hypothetical protein